MKLDDWLAQRSQSCPDRTALIAQTATASSDLAHLRTRASTAAVVQRAERSLSNLAAVRTLFIDRGITAETAYQAYRRAIGDLIENRPALSRWHPAWKSAFEAFMGKK